MKKLLIFAGTTEGRQLAQHFQTRYDITLHVATEYGSVLAGEKAAHGRMSADEMQKWIEKNHFELVVDATHPYAKQVSENIEKACGRARVRGIRLLREKSAPEGCICVPTAQACAEQLCRMPGNVLLATGSKELDVYTAVPQFQDRLYVRILPTLDSISRAQSLGYRTAHIIAMQGPFSKELNKALFCQFNIDILVTKDGGKEGGFTQKHLAAQEAQVATVLITRPKEEGLDMQDVIRILEEMA